MGNDSESHHSRRKVLGLVGGSAGLTIGSTVTAGELGDSAATSAGSHSQPRQSLQTEHWSQQAKLAAEDGDSEDLFGISIATSNDGTTAIIGAQDDEDPNGESAGSTYVFDRNGGEWTQQEKLVPDDGDSGDKFGRSVAVSGDGTTAVVEASGDEDPNGLLAGSAYVFDGSGGEWTQQAKLVPNDGDERDLFGVVAISGDGTTAIIGVSNDDNPNGEEAGSTYVFDRDGGEWTQQEKLVLDNGDSSDDFGDSVATSVDGTTAIIGASGDDDPNGRNSGSAYIFDRSDNEWTQQAKLVPNDSDRNYKFGTSVAVSDNGRTAIVGATGAEDPDGIGAGSAYVFSESGGAWTQQAKLAADSGFNADFFGGSVAVSGNGTTAIVGAQGVGEDDPIEENAGAAYVFNASDGEWTQQAELLANDGDKSDSLGLSTAVSDDGTTAIISAPNDEDPNGRNSGSAYVFGTGENESNTTSTMSMGGATKTTGEATTQSPTNVESGQEDGGSTPGFGVGSLLAALSSMGYLRWRNDED